MYLFACLLQRYFRACLTIHRRVRVVGCVIRLSRDVHHQGTKLPSRASMGPFGMKVSRSFGRALALVDIPHKPGPLGVAPGVGVERERRRLYL